MLVRPHLLPPPHRGPELAATHVRTTLLRADAAALVDDVHDLLVGLVGPDLAATATIEVALRTAARAMDGDQDVDVLTLRRAAVGHAAALAHRDGRSATTIRDLAVLDLVDRRGLDAATAARSAGVRRRSIQTRRAHAAAALASGDGCATAVAPDRATRPTSPAPRRVHDVVDDRLTVSAVASGPKDRTRRVVATAAAAAVALAGIAAATPSILAGTTPAPPTAAIGEPVTFTPTASTVAVASDGDATVSTDRGPASADETAASEG